MEIKDLYMKTVEIDGKIIHIYDDGSIRIPHEGVQLCLDLIVIEQLYSESKKAQNSGGPDQETKRNVCADSS